MRKREPSGGGPGLGGPRLRVLAILLGILLILGLGAVVGIGWWAVRQQVALGPVATSQAGASARLSVSPDSGLPGTLLRVAGRGWQPGDVAFVSLEAPFATTERDFAYAGAIVDKDGQFLVSFTFPQEERWSHAGAIKIVTWAEQSGLKATTIFQVLAPTASPTAEVTETAMPTQALQTVPSLPPATSTPVSKPTPTPVRPVPIPSPLPSPLPFAAENWYGEYFANPTLSGTPTFVRDDPDVRFDWGDGSPGKHVGPDNFSARWTRYLYFAAGTYRFFATADDGVRLWVDGNLVIDQWHEASTVAYVGDVYLWEGRHQVRLEYYKHTGKAQIRLWWTRQEVFPDWKGEYFSHPDLAGQPDVVRNDPQIRFNWGNSPPAQGIQAGNFSVRWTRRVRFAGGTYRFYVRADDGLRVWLDSDLVIDFWQGDRVGLRTVDLSLSGGQYSLRVEYYNSDGDARAELWWELLAATPPAMRALAAPTATPEPSLPIPAPLPQVTEEVPATVKMTNVEPAFAAVEKPTPSPTEATTGLAVNPTEAGVSAPIESPTEVPLVTRVPTEKPTVAPVAASLALRVEPAEAAPGSEVTASGQGWKPGDEVILSLVEPGRDLGAAPPFARALVDARGAFRVKIKVPDDPKWSDLAEIIVLAHSIDWTTRLVTPLRLAHPASDTLAPNEDGTKP